MTLLITDRAEEFRIEISGSFTGNTVHDASLAWRTALDSNESRRISIDISRMTNYDDNGFQLLREMHQHGTHVVAGTPLSLQFFEEISFIPRSWSRPQFEPGRSSKTPSSARIAAIGTRAVASGE